MFLRVTAQTQPTPQDHLMNENWEDDEYKALEEFCYNNHFEYEVLGISFFTKQVAVRLIAI